MPHKGTTSTTLREQKYQNKSHNKQRVSKTSHSFLVSRPNWCPCYIHIKLIEKARKTQSHLKRLSNLSKELPWSRVLLQTIRDSQILKEVLVILWNPKVLSAFHKRQTPVSILNQINAVRASVSPFRRSFLILTFHLCLDFASGLFHLDFLTKDLCATLLSPTCATCSAHLIILDLITRIIFDE